MLEPGKADPDGEVAVLRNGEAVARLRRTGRSGADPVAVVGDREWVPAHTGGGVLVARWAADPGDAVRHRAELTSSRKGTWRVDLEGTAVDVGTTSSWTGALRFSVDGRTVAVT